MKYTDGKAVLVLAQNIVQDTKTIMNTVSDLRQEMNTLKSTFHDNEIIDIQDHVVSIEQFMGELIDATVVVANQLTIYGEMIIAGTGKSDLQDSTSYHWANKDNSNNCSTSFYSLPISIIRSLIQKNYKSDVLPKKGGQWTGERGNSNFIPDDYYVFNIKNTQKTITGRELKQKYSFSHISYHCGEPDFSQFADKKIGIIRLGSIPNKRSGSSGSYKSAAMSILNIFGSVSATIQYMKKNELTWHECSDGTIIAIPTIINSIFCHSGGIYISKGVSSISKNLHQRYPSGFVLMRPKRQKFYLK